MKPHDVPSTGELVEAVREWLQSDVLAATDGRLQYHTRVAINVLSIVERELALGATHEQAHLDRLRSLGVADDAALAAAIRSGELDDRLRRGTGFGVAVGARQARSGQPAVPGVIVSG